MWHLGIFLTAMAMIVMEGNLNALETALSHRVIVERSGGRQSQNETEAPVVRTGKTPPAPSPIDARCRFSSGRDPVDKAFLVGLKQREAALKRCLADDTKTRVLFRFTVDENGNAPVNLISIPSTSPLAGCLGSVIGQRFTPPSTTSRQGTAVIRLSRKQGVIDACSVNIRTIRPLKGIRIRQRPE